LCLQVLGRMPHNASCFHAVSGILSNIKETAGRLDWLAKSESVYGYSHLGPRNLDREREEAGIAPEQWNHTPRQANKGPR
jgi:hypothetical protein